MNNANTCWSQNGKFQSTQEAIAEHAPVRGEALKSPYGASLSCS
jgi:hypothetical protein